MKKYNASMGPKPRPIKALHLWWLFIFQPMDDLQMPEGTTSVGSKK